MFSHEAKQIPRTYRCDVLAVLTTPKKVFSRSNSSDNSVQVLSSIHSNVQLFYLLYCSLPSASALPSSLLKVPINNSQGCTRPFWLSLYQNYYQSSLERQPQMRFYPLTSEKHVLPSWQLGYELTTIGWKLLIVGSSICMPFQVE